MSFWRYHVESRRRAFEELERRSKERSLDGDKLVGVEVIAVVPSNEEWEDRVFQRVREIIPSSFRTEVMDLLLVSNYGKIFGEYMPKTYLVKDEDLHEYDDKPVVSKSRTLVIFSEDGSDLKNAVNKLKDLTETLSGFWFEVGRYTV